MSSQPSTGDQVKNKANDTFETVANAVAPPSHKADYDPNKDPANFTKDSHGNRCKKGDFKDQLNHAAHSGTQQEQAEESYVEKVISHIPGVSSLQQSVYGQGEEDKSKGVKNDHLQLNRPEHDVQVEEFLRTQYHSTSGVGMPKAREKS